MLMHKGLIHRGRFIHKGGLYTEGCIHRGHMYRGHTYAQGAYRQGEGLYTGKEWLTHGLVHYRCQRAYLANQKSLL